jgi:hypothetical protein
MLALTVAAGLLVFWTVGGLPAALGAAAAMELGLTAFERHRPEVVGKKGA